MKLDRLKKRMQKKRIDALLIINKANVRYLTTAPPQIHPKGLPDRQPSGLLLAGFTGSGSALITLDSQLLLTDFRYLEQASREVAGWEIVLTEKSMLKTVTQILKKKQFRRVGFESNISFEQFQELENRLKGRKVIPTKGWVEELRAIKTEPEKKLLKTAARIADQTFRYALGIIKPGKKEREIAIELEYFIKKKKEADTSFGIILVSGSRSSLIHGKPSAKVLRNGDIVLLDLGVDWYGYCSDLTRTICIGRMNTEQKDAYRSIRETQQRAFRKVRAGVGAKQLYSFARKMLEDEGYSLGHGLGHGLGLEIHEYPRMAPETKDVIKKDMVITLEPGIYLKGKFGIRIEDMVLVGQRGAELLTHSPKDIIEL